MEEKQNYYQLEDNCTEISIRFWGNRNNISDILFYFKLRALSKKLNLSYPDFVIEYKLFSYGNFLRYCCRSILNEGEQKNNKIISICSQIINYCKKNGRMPIMEIITCEEKTTVFTLDDLEKIKLSELSNDKIKLFKMIEDKVWN